VERLSGKNPPESVVGVEKNVTWRLIVEIACKPSTGKTPVSEG